MVLRANRIVARFKVRKLFTTDADWVFLSESEFRLSQDRSAVAFAFRALGDGAGSLYLVLSSSHGKYQILMNREAGQARLRVLDADGNLEIWEATYGDECVWCRHRYMIARYRWNGSSLIRVSKRLSRGKPRPAVIAGRPLVIAQAPVIPRRTPMPTSLRPASIMSRVTGNGRALVSLQASSTDTQLMREGMDAADKNDQKAGAARSRPGCAEWCPFISEVGYVPLLGH